MDILSRKYQCIDSEEKELLRHCAIENGFDACGFAEAQPVDENAVMRYDAWVSQEKCAEMQYLKRYHEVRNDPRLLLDGAKSIIAVAMNYKPAVVQDADAPQFAYYAYGTDYHETIRKRLTPVVDLIAKLASGAECRICVDTAPLRERYWAQRAGIGFVGLNNQLIIPGKGSYFFLGFILTTLKIEPDKACDKTCLGCRRCIAYCPGKALCDGEALDARRCISYQTIENRGDLPSDLKLGNRVYGCDTCQKVCPHNRYAEPTSVPEFAPSQDLLSLTLDSIERMTPTEFSAIFRHSAVKRTKLSGLQRNALRILNERKS